jgi:hypothetical protein
MEERRHDSVGEEVFGGGANGGRAETLAKCSAIGTPVGAAVGKLLIPCGREPSYCGEGRDRAMQAHAEFVAGSEDGRGLPGFGIALSL